MALRYDPQPYLKKAGLPRHLLELRAVGGDAGASKDELLAALAASQNADGSFRGGRADSGPGSVPATAATVDVLWRAGAEEVAARGAAWLAAMPRPDGGFAENPALAATLKPEWAWFSAENAVTWITGEAMLGLAAVGNHDAVVNRARNLLLRARNRDGGWPGQVSPSYPDRTDLWTIPGVVRGLLAAGIAANHDVFAGLGGALQRQKDHWRNPVENPLPALLALGRRTSDAEVQECVKLLLDAQNADGGWPYLAGGESHPNPTTDAVTLLVRYRLAALA